MNKKLFIYIALLLIYPWGIYAQWNGFVRNHKKEDFGRGAQTWQIKTYDNKYVFCGNKNGLLQYDGHEWTLLPLSNNLNVRSIYISETKNRIYTGGENEFGYFTPGPTGQLTYTKVSEMYDNPQRTHNSYWGVYEIDNLMYYVSDRLVVKQTNDNFSTIVSDFKIDCSAIIKGVLYVGSSSGIWILVGDTWLPASGSDILQDKIIRAIEPYKDGYLIATAFDGLFYGDANGITPFVTGNEDFMRDNEIFSLATSENYIAVGTIHKGIIIIEPGGKTHFYDVKNGLQNNTVLSICFDNKYGLWVGLDSGIDYISWSTPLTNLYIAPYSKGAGYAALIDGNTLYLGTNRGLFYTDWPIILNGSDIDLKLIPELSGQVWNLEKVGDDIFCLHDKGVFYIRDNKITEIDGLRGGLIVYPHENNEDKCWIGTYDGLFLAEKINREWTVTQRINKISGWIKTALFESSHALWICNTEHGVIRYELDKQTNEVMHAKNYSKDGVLPIENVYIHKLSDEIHFSTPTGIYKYDNASETIVKDEKINSLLPEKHKYVKLVSSGNTLYGISSDVITYTNMQNNSPQSEKVIAFNHSQIDFIKLYENIIAVNDSLAIIPNEFGFALLNTNVQSNDKRNELFVKNVFISYPKDSLLYTDNFTNKTLSPQISYRNNSIRFEYATRTFSHNNDVTYRYRLLPDKVWSEYSTTTTKEYGNLREGNYLFEVEASLQGETLLTQAFAFTISPPWHRSIYALLAYLTLIIGGTYLLYIWDKKRIIKNRKTDLEQKDKEIKLKEEEFHEVQTRKEQEIVTLQNEKLEQELKFKSQEMANLMINFTRKNEILVDIKKELSKVSLAMKDDTLAKAKRMIITLNNSIDSNIASDDALKKFEEQFNIVHNNFIEKIRERHPDLSTNELKMCTYIKMGLSSKEIAPLLNISTRGVETLRYRLRKKIELERDESLTKYINSFL